MNTQRRVLVLATLAIMSTVTLAHRLLPVRGIPADEMTAAAARFVEALSPEPRPQAGLDFDDTARGRWHYVPTEMHPRKGLSVQDMGGELRPLAHALLHSGLGREGYLKATTIMSLESILHRLQKQGRFTRDPEWYFFSIFGDPATDAKWAWRVEGHHLSLNFTVENGRVVAATPAFFGANPARVSDGSSRDGLVTLSLEESLARKLYLALDDTQRTKALIASEAPADIRVPGGLHPPDSEDSGLVVSEMTTSQRAVLVSLITEYAERMPEPVAQQWLDEIKDAGMGKIRFAWAGGDDMGEPHYYRLEGPTFLIEYANTQNGGDGKPANHIHSVWRSQLNDFGLGG